MPDDRTDDRIDDRTDEVVIPALMRAARGSYAAAIAERLEAAGIDDLPRHGAFVLGGMANHGGSAADMIGGLGISKQRASQLVDTLVLRGYLTREVNAEDRRRTTILLTDRGRAAALEVRSAIDQIDAELAHELSPTELAGLRKGLTALALIGERHAAGRAD
jgi:DNA-binding MarR family transcriptional regulator